MPCSLCKNANHTLKECRDVSIYHTIDEITSICVRMVSLPEDAGRLQQQLDTNILLNQLTTYVKRLSCPMLKSILYNKRTFRYIPNEQYIYDRNGDYARGYDNDAVNGNKKTLVAKVIYLFLTNTRREYPIEFLKKDHFVRKLWFEKQMYCSALASNLSESSAIYYQTRYPQLVDKCYIAWMSALAQDAEDLIKESLDSFGPNPVSIGYDLCMSRNRDHELHFHEVRNEHSFQALLGIKYNQLDGLYTKKKILEYLISQYDGSINYTYGPRHTIVLDVSNIPERAPRHELMLVTNSIRRLGQGQDISRPAPRFVPPANLNPVQLEVLQYILQQHPVQFAAAAAARAPANLRKLNIGIVLDKELATCDTFECLICMDTKTDQEGIIRLNCTHEFCACCTSHFLNDYRSKTSNPACPLCRGVIQQITLKNSDVLEDKDIVQNLHNICVL